MTSISIVGLGAMNLDELYQVPSVLADHETTIESHQFLPGGSAANTIYGLAKLDINTGFIGAVGTDEASKLLLKDFRDIGVDISQIKVKKHAKSGVVLGLTDRQGNRALYVEPGANSLLSKKDINLEYIKQAELIHFSSFVNDKQFELEKWVVNNLYQSVKISFAPGAIYTRKGLDTLIPILRKTYILFTNENEIEELAKTEFRAAARHFLNEGCQIVVVTLGKGTTRQINKQQLAFDFANHLKILSAGGYTISNNESEPFRFASYVADSKNEYIIESKPGEKRDTTGAGDAFAAGFLYGLLNGKGLEDCGRLGDIAAHFKIAKIGARPGLPTRNQLTKRYQELYAKE